MSVQLQCQRCQQSFEADRRGRLYCLPCRPLQDAERHAGYEKRDKNPCPQCGSLMVRRSTHCEACANFRRRGTQVGDKNHHWKGGRSKFGEYMGIRVRPGIGSNAYQLEHRYVWEQEHGPLPQGWVVHHLNGVKLDNRLENLAGMPRHEHHTHPRDALKPYEARILELERKLNGY